MAHIPLVEMVCFCLSAHAECRQMQSVGGEGWRQRFSLADTQEYSSNY